MKNLLLILFAVLSLCQCNPSSSNDHIGEFKATLPDFFESTPSMSEYSKKAAAMLDWTLVIDDKEMVLKLSDREHLRMSYFFEGKSIIGRYKWGDKEVYYPFYFKNKDVAYTWGMEFVRSK